MDLIANKIDITGSNIIGLYFSGSYCKYCKEFTPVLIDNYQKLLDNNIDIIYISSDKSKELYDQYRSTQPWRALAYEESDIRLNLREQFDIKTIPALLFFDARDHTLIETNGRNMIRDDCNSTIEQLTGKIIIDYNSDDNDF